MSKISKHIELTEKHIELTEKQYEGIRENEDKIYQTVVELADVMYTAYSSGVGGVAYNGDPLPTWEEFNADPEKVMQRDAWIKAAAAAIHHVGERASPDGI